MGHTSYRDAAYLSLRAMEEYENSLLEDYMVLTSYRDAAYLSLGAMEEYENSSVEDYIGQKVGVKRNGSLYNYETSVHCVSLQQPTHHMQDCAEKRGFNAEAVKMASYLKTVVVKQRVVEKDKPEDMCVAAVRNVQSMAPSWMCDKKAATLSQVIEPKMYEGPWGSSGMCREGFTRYSTEAKTRM